MDEFYEDVAIGATSEFGEYEVTAEEVVDFAERYDPQPFHTDPDAAAESIFGELVASGWHTAAMTMRMLVDGYLSESGAMGAAGVDELRWRNPTRPGDVLHLETEVVEKEPWGSGSGMGVVHSRTRTLTEDDREVMTMVGLVLFPRREAGEDGTE